MITNEKERWVYIREVYNLQLASGPYDFGYGIKLCLLDKELAQLIDNSLWNFRGRSKEYPSWVIEAEPKSQADLIDGDPSRGLRIIPEAMLVVVNPKIKFGPSIHLNMKEGKQETGAMVYDRLVTFFPNVSPNEFIVDDLILREVNRLSNNFIKYIGDRPSIILDRFVRACLDIHADDAIIDLCIALEASYLGRGENKTDNIASRGAAFLGNNYQERDKIFADLATLYWMRNKIVHDCVINPTACLKDNNNKNIYQLRDAGQSHLAHALIKMFNNDHLATKSKEDFINELKQLVKQLNHEFHAFQSKWKYPILKT
jgi:hypothetical protein